RRRHTRFSRDWSSDVCSSDLEAGPFSRRFRRCPRNGRRVEKPQRPLCSTHGKARFRDAMTHPLASPETGLSHFTDSAAGAERVRTFAVLPSFKFFRLSPPTFW